MFLAINPLSLELHAKASITTTGLFYTHSALISWKKSAILGSRTDWLKGCWNQRFSNGAAAKDPAESKEQIKSSLILAFLLRTSTNTFAYFFSFFHFQSTVLYYIYVFFCSDLINTLPKGRTLFFILLTLTKKKKYIKNVD